MQTMLYSEIPAKLKHMQKNEENPFPKKNL